MKAEVFAASDFIVSLLRVGSSSSLSEENLMVFRDTLAMVMRDHYHNHWFPERPFKGSGYRCIRINGQMDPLVATAGASCGLDAVSLRSLFPSELTLWVDPHEVSYRIGENGSVCVLLDERARPEPKKDRVRPAYGNIGGWALEPASACASS